MRPTSQPWSRLPFVVACRAVSAAKWRFSFVLQRRLSGENDWSEIDLELDPTARAASVHVRIRACIYARTHARTYTRTGGVGGRRVILVSRCSRQCAWAGATTICVTTTSVYDSSHGNTSFVANTANQPLGPRRCHRCLANTTFRQGPWSAESLPRLVGCTEQRAQNYNGAATIDDGSCRIVGCTDSNAANFDRAATTDNGTRTRHATHAYIDARTTHLWMMASSCLHACAHRLVPTTGHFVDDAHR